MLKLFENLSPTVQAAIIGGCATLIATIIAGLFSIVKKGKGSKSGTNIKQSQGIGNKGTQIGVQNNTTIKFGDTTCDDGTIIIDCGDASGGGGIRYEPASHNVSKEKAKNE